MTGSNLEGDRSDIKMTEETDGIQEVSRETKTKKEKTENLPSLYNMDIFESGARRGQFWKD